MEGDAPGEREDVGLEVWVEDSEGQFVFVEVGVGVEVGDKVVVADGVGVGLAVSVKLTERELEAVLEGEAPDVREGVGDEVREAEMDDVVVSPPVPLLLLLQKDKGEILLCPSTYTPHST